MILWLDGAHDARENMTRDAALLERAAADPGAAPVMRLFTFAPPGITLGANQRAADELDLERCAADGVGVAVRPTGGRGIFHDEEWTFSLASPLGPSGWARDAAAAYARTCTLLATALRSLGAPVELAPGSPRGVGAPRGGGTAAAPCFASTARHELVVEGRKAAGIAQRETRGALLQQGSLLLGRSHERLGDYLKLDPAGREAARWALARGACPLGSWLGPRPALRVLADALRAAAAWDEVVEGARAGAFPPGGAGEAPGAPRPR